MAPASEGSIDFNLGLNSGLVRQTPRGFSQRSRQIFVVEG